jgi:hypothetical protein
MDRLTNGCRRRCAGSGTQVGQAGEWRKESASPAAPIPTTTALCLDPGTGGEVDEVPTATPYCLLPSGAQVGAGED